MKGQFFGGIMLIIGTTIGGGMLALPVSTAVGGFFPGVCLLVICWAIMLSGALLILETNLCLPANSNLITMAGKTLGRPGQIVSWITYFLLLYALLAVYISGGTEITQHWLEALLKVSLPTWLASIIFTLIMGYIVYRGIQWVDFVNRGLLSSKLLFCLALIVFLIPFVSVQHLDYFKFQKILGATTVVVTSFGFSTIVPSLRAYFKSDLKQLRSAIIIGSLIPLVAYIAWNAVVQGVIPTEGEQGLLAMQASGEVTVNLSNSLTHITQNTWVAWLGGLFTSICVLTSFLGVALCMTDFLADGFKISKEKHGFIVILGTLVPPLGLIFFIPHLFIKALAYAGIYCVILLILLPALMAYSRRYIKKIPAEYEMVGGKIVLVGLIILSCLIILLDIFNQFL